MYLFFDKKNKNVSFIFDLSFPFGNDMLCDHELGVFAGLSRNSS